MSLQAAVAVRTLASAAVQMQHNYRADKGRDCRAFDRSFICVNLGQGSATLIGGDEASSWPLDDQVSTQGTPRAMACIAFVVTGTPKALLIA
jgi:hypothetical protein